MSDAFERLLLMAEPEALSLNAQAALGSERPRGHSQFWFLVRHFLERFFNHETASPDGDAKTRLVQIAFAAGLPGLTVAIYLWPVYHPLSLAPPGHHFHPGPPPYWLQVNHHFFFVMYSFVAMGIVTVFEWDLFFPDLIDVLVLNPLPVLPMRMFRARVAAIGLLLAGFLFDANCLAPLVLPAATDPPNLPRFLAGHLLAVAMSGVFGAVFILALQGMLLSLFGEYLFRKLSLLIQGLCMTGLVMLLLLFPVLSGVTPALLQSGSPYVLCFPPFWFLGIYQRFLEGPSALPIYIQLAHTGYVMTFFVAALAVFSYPVAYLRRERRLIEGSASRSGRNWFAGPFGRLLHVVLIRPPVRRAVFHFISQTIFRVPRYRIYLVLYGGVGLSAVFASVLRFGIVHNHVRMEISADGIRASISIVAFWVVTGLRMAFVSSGNERGRWVFGIVHGNPAHFRAALEQSLAAKIWVILWAGATTFGACAVFHAIAPPELLTWPAVRAQVLVATGVCLLFADVFFLHVTTVAFTGGKAHEEPNPAFTLLKYFTFFPIAIWLSVVSERWIEGGSWRTAAVAGVLVAMAHGLLQLRHRAILREHCRLFDPELGENEFLTQLGLGD
jgi:hypothetical protein